jgi:hypothetical protein
MDGCLSGKTEERKYLLVMNVCLSGKTEEKIPVGIGRMPVGKDRREKIPVGNEQMPVGKDRCLSGKTDACQERQRRIPNFKYKEENSG